MYTSPLLPVRHGFTTASEGDHRPGRDPKAGGRLLRCLDAPGPLRTVVQVHGARVVSAQDCAPTTEADGLVGTTPGVVLAIRVADCVPLLYAAPGAVAAVHAGWRGTAAGIAGVGLVAVCAAAGCSPGDVTVAIGPCICGDCYAVGDEVRAALAAGVPGDTWRVGSRNVDLGEANAALLRSLGARIDRVEACTRCTPGLWSHRRDGETAGRQVGAIRL